MNTILNKIIMKSLFRHLLSFGSVPIAHAHCDGPCGVYDPAQARVAAEAVLSMTKKLLALEMPNTDDEKALLDYHNTLTRYIQIKEDEAENAKRHLLILWTDYFKQEHLENYPDLHTIFWEATKLCSAVKQHVDQSKANALLDVVQKVHEMFWSTKGRDVPWTTAV
jgi:nickel superoxide dismutase